MPVSLSELKEKRAEILDLVERYRARNPRVFGSIVRGEIEPWSDVDLLIDPLPGHSLFDRAGLIVDLRELLRTPVDVVTDAELKTHVRERAHAEAVAI